VATKKVKKLNSSSFSFVIVGSDSGWIKKIRIRDKHPGSAIATLQPIYSEKNGDLTKCFHRHGQLTGSNFATTVSYYLQLQEFCRQRMKGSVALLKESFSSWKEHK
jgi:hypothetical protein